MDSIGQLPGSERWLRLWREYRTALGITAFFLGLSLWIQNGITSSPMTLDESIWAKKLEVHLTYGPFAVRYFQSYATLALHNLFSWPIRESFFLVQYALALTLGPLFFRFLGRVGFDRCWSLVGLVLLMSTYPIVGAHFAPTHTWDDFWSYLFLVLSFTALLDKRAVAAGVYLALGCLAREQITLFWPVLALGLWGQQRELKKTWLWTGLLMPPVAVAIFRFTHSSPLLTSACDLWERNFGDPGSLNDTIVSTIITFGWLWILALVGLFFVWQRLDHRVGRLLFMGMLTALPATVWIAWSCALARETRLMFPPFVFIIPLALVALSVTVKYILHHRTVWLWIALGCAAIPAVVLGVDLSWDMFSEADYGTNAKFRRDLVGIYFGLIGLYVTGLVAATVVSLLKQRRHTNTKRM